MGINNPVISDIVLIKNTQDELLSRKHSVRFPVKCLQQQIFTEGKRQALFPV